ncbi:Endonuclease IV [Ruminococcaceae bacterium YRB3002]|nr:Endonuclease IV [Ruminococcaceae bacterium YRB3002]
MINIGCHLSSSGGFLAMGKHATELGADTFAFFTRNPRGGSAKEIIPEDAQALVEYMKANGFGKLVAHAPYTMNVCAEKENIRKFSWEMLADDLDRMQFVPGNYYNFHPGSHVGQGVETAIPMIADAINSALKPEHDTTVLLETMAGKGSEVGRTFDELAEIISRVELKDKIGVCFDTCHTWDGGYDNVDDFDGVLSEFDKVIGLDRLLAVHLNDSKNGRDSHKDRHEVIGGGFIGEQALRNIVTHPLLQGKPFILETPNEDPGYAKEIALIRSWME